MNQKLLSKVLATILVMTLTFANFILLGVYATNSYATSDNLEKQGTTTNNENVEFDAYFKDAKGSISHSVKQDRNQADMKLYLSIKVKKGYLKNAAVKAFGEDTTKLANFSMLNSDEPLTMIQKLDTQNNQIDLKQLDQNTEVVLEIPITATKNDTFDLSDFSKENGIRLIGEYVTNEGKTVQIDKTIRLRTEWTATAKVEIGQVLQRYVPYEVKGEKGVILQTIVTSGLENNSLPIQQTDIEITVPTINGIKPSKVNVTANTTVATNAQDGLKFGTDNWSYEEETGIIHIQVKNDAQDNKVAWIKEGKDEYVVTYVFPQEVITEEGIVGVQTVKASIRAYNSVETVVEETISGAIQVKDKIGEIVTQQVKSAEEALSKGYLYNKAEREIQYHVTSITDIGYAELVDTVVIENRMDYFVNEKGEISPTSVAGNHYAYYKMTSIRKENFEKILGQEGTITIKDQDGATLATFDKNTQVDDKGNYVYEYMAETNKVTIETSKPVTSGKLEIQHTKNLKGKTDYARTQIANFKTINVMATTTLTSEGTVIGLVEANTNINLVDPTTKIEAGISTDRLSTIVKNENVELRVILKTNDISCDLYKNPVVEIVLPSYIQDIEMKDINLLFDDQLKIKGYDSYTNDVGNKVIRVVIEGEDTKYNQDEISKGANIVINTDITLKQLTPTKQDVMKVYVTNENATSYENTEATKARSATQKGYVETSLKAVAPVGMVTTNQIIGYNSKNETVTSISGQEQVGKLETKTDARIATLKMDVINNYNNVVKNINILGRIPVEGNKDIVTGADLGSNLTTILKQAIAVSGVDASKVTIYYSSNANATKDTANSSNGWTKSLEDITNVKSYLIVLQDYEMNTGDSLSFNYPIEIPQQLGHNKSTYGTYVVYFDNVGVEQTIQDKTVATKVGLTTGEGPELEVSVKANVDNGVEVQEGDIVTYTVSVKNIGKSAVHNVTLQGNIPQKTVYTYYEGQEGTQDGITQRFDSNKKEYKETFETIGVNEVKTIQYMVKVGTLNTSIEDGHEEGKEEENLPEHEVLEEVELSVIGQATVEGNDTTFKSGEIKNKVVRGYIQTNMKVAHIDASYGRAEGQEIIYETEISNVNEIVKENIVVTNTLPEGVSFKEANLEGVYDKQTNAVTWKIDKLQEDEKILFILKVTVDTLPEGQYERTIVNKMNIKTPEKELMTNEISIVVKKPGLTVKQTTDTKQTVSVNDTIIYNVTITNIGAGATSDIIVVDYLPQELSYLGAEYTYNGNRYESKVNGNPITITIPSLQAGESVIVKITGKVNALESEETEKQITNVIKVTSSEIGMITANDITHTIVSNKDEIDDPSVDDVIEGTSTISGVTWFDTNKNGQREDEEITVGGISVMLVNAENGKMVTDIITGKDKIQQTNENGQYTFANIKPGKYMVVFLYDAGNYGLTTYQKEGVNTNRNSDVIAMKINWQGEIRQAGVTNTIEVKDSNVTCVDMGLVVNPKFDLRLDKVISKITVNEGKNTTTHEYNDTKLAKLDLNPKTVNDTSIAIEYKIKVTNEGGIAGYAKKIVDYLPQDMKFSSELNQDWYSSENGNIYNGSLANTLLQPGETKELALVLTKKMTENNTGNINNNAEIYEAYNDLGFVDIDSTPANKMQGEDDISNADAIIAIKTGEVYVYTIVTLVCIGLLGVGIYFINKKVLRKI